jgi:dolichyl-phosphate-mannose--protein O-mannosyl transferase
MSFIDNLQKKPKKTRVLIVWIASICVMIIIIIIWLFSFSHNLTTNKNGQTIEDTEIPSLFESIGKDFSLIKEKLGASFKSIKDQINEGETEQQ